MNTQKTRAFRTTSLLPAVLLFISLAFHAGAAVFYVNLNNPTPVSPYTNWTTAATTIQQAIDVASPGDEIQVTNGTYQTGSVSAGNQYYTRHRIALDKPVTVISVNGPAFTGIVGGHTSFGTRCAYLTNGAMLAGFTLSGGEADLGLEDSLNQRGAGVLCQSVSCIVSNCNIVGNIAGRHGGGAYSGTLINCQIIGNTCRDLLGARIGDGGGTYGSNLKNCVVVGNSARYAGAGAIWGTMTDCLFANNAALSGGGAAAATLINCTVVSNTAFSDGGVGGGIGGGVSGGTVVNSIVVQNRAWVGQIDNYSSSTFSFSCSSPLPAGEGNISDDPAFIDFGAGNFRLQTSSPCVNAGSNTNVVDSLDVDGKPRIVDGVVDMGAHERQRLPWIVFPPVSQSILLNSNVQFNVLALGDEPLSYQWQMSETNLPDGGRISGVSTSSLAISPVLAGDAGSFRVIVTNALGAVTSAVANLTILFPPSILASPTNRSAGPGASVSFNVAAAGTAPLAFQWRKDGTNLVNGGTISGADTAALQLGNVDTNSAGIYDVIVSSPYGTTNSAAATLSILPLAINTQPLSRTVPAGTNVTFTVGASGFAAVFYQWRFNQLDLPGATNTALTVTNVQAANAGGYDVVVTNIYNSLTSSVATLTVVPAAPIITTQAASRVVSVGQNVPFITATKGSEPMTNQWQFNGVDLPGANSFTLTLTNVNWSHVGVYRDAVSNVAGGTFTTNATLSVTPVIIWGMTNNPQALVNAAVPAAATNVMAIAAGPAEGGLPCLALRADGRVVAWGYAPRDNPPPTNSDIVAVSVNGASTFIASSIVLRSDGTVVHWTGLSKPPVPPAVTNGNVVAVAAGGAHQLALRDDGTVIVWGSNSSGQTNLPASVTNVIAIAAGGSHSLALRADGTVVGWGLNANGQTTALNNFSNIVAIAAGGNQSIALLADGTVVGRIVTNPGPVVQFQYGPVPSNATNMIGIAAGSSHMLALRANRTAVGWGQTNAGQLTPPPHATNLLAIAAGGGQSLGLVRDPFAPPIPPRIGRPPLGRALKTGQNVVLNALAIGGLPLRYQWYRDGTLLEGKTNSWLAFISTHPGDAGNYQFVAMNDFGSATSAVASVTVSIPQPILKSAARGTNGFSFQFDSVSGVLYVTEFSSAPGGGTWTELERRFGGGGLELVIDPNAGGGQRYYRVRALFAPEPKVGSLHWSGGAVNFNFASVAGAVYVVQYKNKLDDPAWTELMRQTSTGAPIAIVDTNPPASSRYYRVKVE